MKAYKQGIIWAIVVAIGSVCFMLGIEQAQIERAKKERARKHSMIECPQCGEKHIYRREGMREEQNE